MSFSYLTSNMCSSDLFFVAAHPRDPARLLGQIIDLLLIDAQQVGRLKIQCLFRQNARIALLVERKDHDIVAPAAARAVDQQVPGNAPDERRRIGETRCLRAAGRPHEHFLYQIGRGIMSRTASQIARSEEHTSELQSLMRISYAVFCLKKKKKIRSTTKK